MVFQISGRPCKYHSCHYEADTWQ